MARLIPALLRVDARRPASWLALAGAVACGVGGATAVPAVPTVVAAGGLLTVAAIGQLSVRSQAALGPLGPLGLAAAWAGLRAVWPGAGFLLAAAGLAADGNAAAGIAVSGAASGFCTAAVYAWLIRARCTETMAASRSLMGTGSAAAAAVVAQLAGLGPVLQGAAAVAACGIVVALSVSVAAAAGPGVHRQPEAGAGAAMATALAAMVGGYFLAPQFAWAYAVLAVAWFVTLAVPPATAGAGGLAGTRLRRSAAGRPEVPGSVERAVRGLVTMLGLLAWPAVVAGLLPAADGSRVGGPVVALGWLGGVAGLLGLAVVIGLPRGRTEAVRAFVLSAVALAVLAAAGPFPRLPRFPGLSPAKVSLPVRTGVEPSVASCKTS